MISDRIKSMREKTFMTQTELAKKLGISRSSVNAWEMGISVPSTQYLVELAHLFKVTTDFLLGIDTDKYISIEGIEPDEAAVIRQLVEQFRRSRERISVIESK